MKKSYKAILKQLNQAEQQLEETKQRYNAAQEEIALSRKEIDAAIKLGVIVLSNAEVELQKAKMSLQNGMYNEAIEFAVHAKEIAIKAKAEVQAVLDSINSAQSAIEHAQDSGVRLTAVEDLFQKAQNAHEIKDFKNALSYARQAETVAKKAEEGWRSASTTLELVQTLLTECKGLDIDVVVAENLVKKAKEALEIGNYNEAVSFTTQAKQRLQEIKVQYEATREYNDKIRQAQGYEKALRYEDAIKLYEQLELWDDAGRVRKIMKGEVSAREEIERLKQELVELKEKYKSGELTRTEVEKVHDEARSIESSVKESGDKISIKELKELMQSLSGLRPQVSAQEYYEGGKMDMEGAIIQRSTISTEEKAKTLSICPYCGEKLNLPETPNYCPYCKKKLIL